MICVEDWTVGIKSLSREEGIGVQRVYWEHV